MDAYGINDIESLSFRDGVRKRIEMYLGSADMQGVYNAIQEIISNCIDEYYMGYGNKIHIVLKKGNQITITDCARGIPFGIKENGSNVLVDIFTKSHTGGKFNDKVYQSVGGLNGTGAKATCLSSESFSAGVWRDGKYAQADFEKGILVNYEESISLNHLTGTQITFVPDKEVYHLEDINIDFQVLCDKCKNLSYLTKGLTFELEDKSQDKIVKITYCAKNGILDLLKDNVDNPIHPNPIYQEYSDGVNQIEIAVQWTKGKEKSYVFTNGLHNSEGGTSLTGLRTSITRNLNKIFNKSFSGEMARTGLVYAVSVKTPKPSFANQTKTKINNPELRGLADKTFSDAIAVYIDKYPQDTKIIRDFLSREEKAELAADRARSAVLDNQKKVQTELKKKSVLAGKLADCRSHGEDSQLLIVEGKSALGGIIKARDSEFTACYPLRGKLINVLKNDLEDVMNNQEIQELNIALGCGFGESFNIKKLRYGRIVIMADADVDGYSIMCLVLTYFYKFYPELIRAGKIYWGKTPLFVVTTKAKTYYAYDDEELKALPKGEITRLKGLGESDPIDFTNTIFSPEGRYVQFTMNDAAEAYKYFELLLGQNINERRKYIFANINFEEIED